MINKFLNIIAYILVRLMSFGIFIEDIILNILNISSTKFENSFKARIQYFYLKRNISKKLLRWAEIPFVNKKFLVNPCSSMFKWVYFKTGNYELNTTEFIYNNLNEGDIFVDIGANAGYFTILAASKVGEKGCVYSFEPNPNLYINLRLSITENNLDDIIILSNKAISNTDKKSVELYISNDNSNDGISSLIPGNVHLESGDLSQSNTIEVETIKFDSFINDKVVTNVKIIKIDIEGAEYEAIQGMNSFIEKTKPNYIICETTMGNNVCELLSTYGYQYKPIEYLVPEENWGNILFTYSGSI